MYDYTYTCCVLCACTTIARSILYMLAYECMCVHACVLWW